MTDHLTRPVVLGALIIGNLAWIDPLFMPMILLGPPLSGVAAGRRGLTPSAVALMWFGAGLVMLVSDFAVNHEDVAFHAGVAAITAGIAYAFTTLAGRRAGVRRTA